MHSASKPFDGGHNPLGILQRCIAHRGGHELKPTLDDLVALSGAGGWSGDVPRFEPGFLRRRLANPDVEYVKDMFFSCVIRSFDQSAMALHSLGLNSVLRLEPRWNCLLSHPTTFLPPGLSPSSSTLSQLLNRDPSLVFNRKRHHPTGPPVSRSDKVHVGQIQQERTA